jgi:Protein of unknown function (DUF2865)
MRRAFQQVAWSALVAWAAITHSTTASAQGFLQQLFGFAAPAAEPQRPAQPVTPGGRPYHMPSSPFFIPQRSSVADDTEDRANRSSAFRTVCVRMCDGFYFPISNSTTRKGFFKDQTKCRAACGEDARLFHLPVNATAIDAATDQQGRVYGYLPIAFKYRKTLVTGCQCKPEPWSDAELSRHQQYADAEFAKAPAVAVTAATQTAAVDAPKPIDATTQVEPAKPAIAQQVRPLKLAKAALKPPVRTLTAARPGPVQSAQAKPLKPYGSSMGLGGGQLSWPGDPPRRVQ